MQGSHKTDMRPDGDFRSTVIDLEDGEPSAAIDEIIDHVSKMVAEYGNGEPFDAREWVNQWLDRYVPALAGQPRSFLGTPEGRKLVKNALDMTWSGTYA